MENGYKKLEDLNEIPESNITDETELHEKAKTGQSKEEDNEKDENREKEDEILEKVELEEESMATMSKVLENFTSFEEGEIIKGKIVSINPDSVFVDIGYKSEGEISLSEFKEQPNLGDEIEVMVIRKESREGRPILSKKKADETLKWEELQQSYEKNKPVEGKIIKMEKAGFEVDLGGIKGFAPMYQVIDKKEKNPERFIGEILPFKIERINKNKNNITLSHKKYLEEKREEEIKRFFSERKVGEIIEGTVKDIVNYGAFINLGCIDALLHINDISWGKVTSITNHIKKGERIKCKILAIDPENRKVSVGLKQTMPNPWDTFEEKYKRGNRYKGEVTKLTNFGAFVKLEEGIEGLLHVSEMSWTKRIRHPREVLRVGDKVEIMLLDYDLNKKTVSLGLKQVLPNPWDTIDEKYPVGSTVRGKVTKITDFGVFIEIEDGIEGVLFSEDISWTKQVKNPGEFFTKGKKVNVMVLSIDKENRRIKFGYKQLMKNPWEALKVKHPVGSVVTGKVTGITEFGVFLKIDKDIEGLIHISQLSNERVEDPSSVVKIGDEIKAVVLEINEEKRKVTLSVKDYLNRLEREDIKKYIADDISEEASITLGDIIDLNKIGT
ncbi:MAG: 30S ribosomal protein S1 [Spirochaetes bacterium]|nr:MAG: 30S ribosomal protein S1 [Spirochaetota bacterium]